MALSHPVIPGRDEVANPESIGRQVQAEKWIPGSMLSHRPGMTEAKKSASDFKLICLVQPCGEKHSASVVGQISTMTPRVSPE